MAAVNFKIPRFILNRTKKALLDYKMIEDGDKIAVGVSGGKDSLILLYVLRYFQKSLLINFELLAVTVTLGWGTDFEPVARFCSSIGVPYEQVNTRIGPIIFETRKEKNPCALCSRMRRGALDDRAKKRGFGKVALGHNFDDALETLFLSMFYEGRTRTFLPRIYLDRKDLTLIRPLVYVPEKKLSILAEEKKLPVVDNSCPAAGKTKRQVVKEIVDYIEERVPRARYRLWLAMQRIERDHLWPSAEELEKKPL